jgi:mannose-6-phosphate isomerase-like protein (cupin superfamily)
VSTQQRTAREAGGDASRELDFRPGMDMHWEITQSTDDSGAALLEATNWVGGLMGGPPVHVHPTAEETYAVIEGAADVFIDGEWRTVRAGESVTVPAGMPHTIKNSTPDPVQLVNTHRPALRFEAMFRELHDLIQQGKIKRLPPKDPRSAMYAAMLFAKYPDEQRMVKPPQALFNALARLGRVLGLKLSS